MGFKGCLLIVSHDRYFMDKVADTLFILEDDGSVSGYVGKCSEYIDYRKMKLAEKEAEEAAKKASTEKKKAAAPEQNTQSSNKPRKKTFKEQKEFETLEAEIEQLEEKKSALEADMGSTDYEKAAAAGEEYKTVSHQLENDYKRWEELAELA